MAVLNRRQAFIQRLFPIAQQWEQRTGIPADTWLAMAASESNWGNAGNSLFGIKGQGNAGSISSPSWESVNGQRVNTTDNFANYKTPDDAFAGFWRFVHQPRYAAALVTLQNGGSGYEFTRALNDAGYATDPNWAESIQNIAQGQIQPMIGSGGDTMGTMQDGTDPNLNIDPALIDAAINGDTPGATSPGFVPDGNVGTLDQNAPSSADPTGSGADGTTILRMLEAKLGGGETEGVVSKPTITKKDSTFGDTEVPNPQITKRYTWPNGKSVDIVFETGKPAIVKGGTALAALAQGSSPAVREFPDKSLRQEDTSQPLGSPGRWVKIADAPAGTASKTINTKGGTFENDGSGWALIPGTAPAGASLQIHTFGDGSLHSYDPQTGQWALVQARYVDPAEEAYKQALTAEANANTAKTLRGLRPVAVQAFIDADAAIKAIADQYASGQISLQEANSLSKQVHDGIAATIAGTTLFEQQKQAQDTQTQRAGQASNFLQQRISSAASLGSSLLSAATGHVMLPKGQKTLGIDPFAIANQEVNTMGGGQSTGDAAAAFLKAAFGGQTGGASVPGAPAQSPYPTTREAVLAQYPDLGQAPAQAPTAPVAPAAPVQTQPTPPSNIQTLLASIGQGGR